jgi:dephospho-CoA kinase
MSSKNKCFTIGLTGGIASGKSAVSRFFEELGSEVIDTDIEARTVVEPGTEGLKLLVDEFGPTILAADKTLNRAKLRHIVFNDAHKLATLNSILHPLIQQSVIKKIQQTKSKYCIIVIPLLCESTSYDWLDRILVVDVKRQTQLKRLLARDSIDEDLANKMLESQCSRKQRLSIANDVINNENSLEDLRNHVVTLNRLYKSL